MTFNIEIQAAFMFYHKWIPCTIMKTQVFPCLTQKRPMPTFLQSLGWSSAAYASWSCHWKTPHGSENRCLSFQRSAVVTGCFQMKLVVLRLLAFFIVGDPLCKEMAVFSMSHCSHRALQASCRPWCSLSRGSQLVAHPSGCICWMFQSRFRLYALLEPPEAQFDKIQVGLNHLSVFQISNWLLAKFTSGSIFYSIFTVSIISFWLKPAEGRQAAQMHETVRKQTDTQWNWNYFFCVETQIIKSSWPWVKTKLGFLARELKWLQDFQPWAYWTKSTSFVTPGGASYPLISSFPNIIWTQRPGCRLWAQAGSKKEGLEKPV